MKINIGRDSLHAYNLSENSQGYRYRLASQWLEFSFENVEIDTVENLLDKSEKFIYEIGTHNGPKQWCISPDGQCNLFNLIPNQIKTAMKNSQCLLHIDQTMEAFPLHEYTTQYNKPRSVDYYKSIHSFCEDIGINPSLIVYSTSNLLEPLEYSHWCEKNSIHTRFNIIALPFFACATQQRGFFDLIDRPDTGDDPHDVPYSVQCDYKRTESVQTFNCLNRVYRVHRTAFVAMLNHYKLIENNIVSHNIFQPHIKKSIMMERWPDHPAFNHTNVVDIKSKLPLVYDMKDFTINYAQNFNKDIYKKTWLSVITETFYQEPSPVVFFSEKIFKPMRAHHPFVIVGHYNSIKWLNRIGFKTFGKWWDESYDNIEDPTARMDLVCKLLVDLTKISTDKWIKIYEEMESVLKHNYKILIETNWYEKHYQKVVTRFYNDTTRR